MTTYLGYVMGGKCKDTHRPPQITKDTKGIIRRKYPQTHKQFWVIDELASLGITAWCGRRIDFYRTGKNRYAEAHESPFLPNYLFIEMDADQFYTATQVKHLSPTFQMVPRGDDLVRLADFKNMVDAGYRAAQKIDANSKAAVAQYKQGQELLAKTGPFMDMEITFNRMVQGAGDAWPRVEGLVNMLGRMTPVQFDPLDIGAAR